MAAPRPVQSYPDLSHRSVYSESSSRQQGDSHVCPNWISPLPTLIKLRLSPRSLHLSHAHLPLFFFSSKASQPRTVHSPIVARVFIISYLSSLRKHNSGSRRDKNTERRCPPLSQLLSCLFVRTPHFCPFSLFLIRVREQWNPWKKSYSNIRLSWLTLSPPHHSSLPGQTLGRL